MDQAKKIVIDIEKINLNLVIKTLAHLLENYTFKLDDFNLYKRLSLVMKAISIYTKRIERIEKYESIELAKVPDLWDFLTFQVFGYLFIDIERLK